MIFRVEKVLTCYHCGNETVMERIANHTHTETETFGDEHLPNHFTIQFHWTWRLYLCKVCINVTLEHMKNNDDDIFSKEEMLLYPFQKNEEGYIPEKVARAYESALKVKNIDGAICAIAIRRTLEMVCEDKAAKGKNLFEKLNDLSEKSGLPPIIEEMTTVLREIGNTAAHSGDSEFDNEVVPSLLEFTEKVLEYVYYLPSKLEEIQNRIQNQQK